MMVTFPHFGPLYISVAKLLSYLNVGCVVPPNNDESALSEGGAISPEEMCVPFKFMAGNLAKAYKLGADTALMVATDGPCRLGQYGQLLKYVLDEAGYKFNWILLDTISSVGVKESVRRFDRLLSAGGADTMSKIKGVMLALRLIHKIDGLRAELQLQAGYLKEPQKALTLFKKTESALAEAGTFGQCFSILKGAKKELGAFPRKKGARPVKVMVAGEIYTSVEPMANGRLEEKLMTMGCSVKRHIDIWWWIRYTLGNAVIPEKVKRMLFKNKPISFNVGGYGRETADRIIKDRWCDGIIKIMPAGCMPEIVTKAYCQAVQEEKDLNILHLIYDEMGGQAGYETRIEAFIDMLERRRDVLAGDRYRIN